ncbi:MAG: class III cytochrome C family protein [Magnetococcales bacterium]|nr:class III cytochrome C family protein [Magnetococcales bacterium]
MKRPLPIVLSVFLVVVLFSFLYPERMIAPGKLSSGHGHLADDCFSCHSPFSGLPSQKCLKCHQIESIGLMTTRGLPIERKGNRVRFHHQLAVQECMACHSDHEGVARYRTSGAFSHDALEPSLRLQCSSCHQRPDDALHRASSASCGTCHRNDHWQPATFEHTKWFELDRDHAVACDRCHKNNDIKQYSCYGCHEHSPEKIRREHLEEGIGDFERCVSCHRNANEEDAKKGRHEKNRRNEERRKTHGHDNDEDDD